MIHAQTQNSCTPGPKEKEMHEHDSKVNERKTKEIKAGNKSKKENEIGVDSTVEKLLSDMAKKGASEEGIEAAQMEQMGEGMMESIMKEFEKMGQKGDADDVVNGMMKELLSKELMYEPMKQVNERFPRWLAESKPHLSDADYIRYFALSCLPFSFCSSVHPLNIILLFQIWQSIPIFSAYNFSL